MAPIVVLDTDSVTLWYHADKKIVHHQVKKYMHGDPFRDFLLKGTETMRKNRAHKWLSDDRKNPVLNQEDLAWAQTGWFPQTLQAGWKYWAIVQPEFAIAKVTMDKLAKQYTDAGVTTKFFHDPDEAMKWLESQP